ncbi:MAG: hypothetical protein FJW23_07925 [Acidimicrobiia bacterium]|nr:hypothetical protein [Acidimicrobiia bacterium]
MTDATDVTESAGPPAKRGGSQTLGRLVFLAIAIGCFLFLYFRLNGAAQREGMSLAGYMTQVFTTVQWAPWLALMMAYSLAYFVIDTLVITQALTWFIKPIRFRDIMPIRGSSYVISLVSEQIGKGAMAYYLNRRDGVPGWETGSVMLFVMFGEVFYLMTWAAVGYFVSRNALPGVFDLIPVIALGGAVFLTLWILYFRGVILPGNTLRDKKILHAFKLATPAHYLKFFLLRSPALLSAVVVYTVALGLFGVEADLRSNLGFLPIIFFAATVPTPMRAAAITLWVVLFPENEGAMAAFGFVQHNFFILFNALIGVVFWRRAQRELFGR